jgi:FAD/FMN-containing dehydrogenase
MSFRDLTPFGPALAADLRSNLPSDCFRPAAPHYLEEPRGRYHGQAGVVLAPDRVEDVARIVQLCGRHKTGLVPYGGGTGLVGGQVMPEGPVPVILSLERMNKIRDVDPQDNVIVAEAGVILADLQAAAENVGRLFPLSLASEGSCRIGGNLSTNAGGVQVLRYGNARDLCLGLEAVLPDGTIWNGLSRLRKDNTGYDLRNLLVGAEGTLGIITAASLKLFPRPRHLETAFLAIRDPQAALELLTRCRDAFGEGVSVFELMHRQGMAFLSETMKQVRLPFGTGPEWMLLIELGLSGLGSNRAAFEAVLADAIEAGLVDDALVAQSDQQRQDFWTVRESIPLANRMIGAIYSHDISVPVSRIPEFIARAGQAVAALAPVRVNCFGHLGDGNLHYNVYPEPGRNKVEYQDLVQAITDTVYGLVHEMGGSVSAEHGIGRLKTGDLQKYGDPVRIRAMRALKQALDPVGIMNPGAVLVGD